MIGLEMLSEACFCHLKSIIVSKERYSVHISLEIVALSNIGEDVQYRCFNYVYDVKSVSQPDTMPI